MMEKKKRKANDLEEKVLFYKENVESYENHLKKKFRNKFFCSHKGVGLISAVYLKKGSFIGIYRGSYEEFSSDEPISLSYDFEFNGKILHGDPKDMISTVNDSIHNANSKMVLMHGLPILVAIRDIQKDEELLYNYTQSSTSSGMPWRKLKKTHIKKHDVKAVNDILKSMHIFQNDQNHIEVEDKIKPLYCEFCKFDSLIKEKQDNKISESGLEIPAPSVNKILCVTISPLKNCQMIKENMHNNFGTNLESVKNELMSMPQEILHESDCDSQNKLEAPTHSTYDLNDIKENEQNHLPQVLSPSKKYEIEIPKTLNCDNLEEKDRSPSTLFEVNNDTMVKEDLRKKNVFDSSTTQMFDKKKSPKITLKNDPCILIEEVQMEDHPVVEEKKGDVISDEEIPTIYVDQDTIKDFQENHLEVDPNLQIIEMDLPSDPLVDSHSDVRSETEEDSTTNELEENSTNELDEFSIEKNIIESPIKTLIAGETWQAKIDECTRNLTFVKVPIDDDNPVSSTSKTIKGPKGFSRKANSCPVAGCISVVKNLSRHLRSVHDDEDETFIKNTILSLRKKRLPLSKESEIRTIKKCPECNNEYSRLDLHLRRTHKWKMDSQEYRSFVKFRKDNRIAIKDKTYRDDVSQIWNEVRIWLQTPSGGGQSADEARQVSYKIRQVLQDLPKDIVEHISEEKYWDLIESWFVKYSSRCQASSAKAYLFAFKTYMSFVLSKRRHNYDSMKDIEVNNKLKKLTKFLSKRHAQQRSCKFNIPIRYEDIRTFERSEHFRQTKSLIEMIDRRNFPIRDIDVREFLAINLLLNNGCRPCVIANMTEEEYLNGQRVDSEDCVIVIVSNHKNIMQGKARLAIPYWLHDIIEIYRQYIRPENLVNYEFAGRDVTPCIATENGTKYSSTLISVDINACWAKAGLDSKIMATYLRKLAVTGVHEYGTQADKDRAAQHQAHSVTTAATYYKQKHMAEEAAIDSKIVRMGMTGELKEKYETSSKSNCSKGDFKKNLIQSEDESDEDYSPEQVNDSSDSERNSSPIPKKRKIDSKCTSSIKSPPVTLCFEASYDSNKRGRGQKFFSEQQRSIIEKAFYPYIHGCKPTPGIRVKPPRMALVKEIIETENLDERLSGKANPLKVLGCIKGILNKIHGYKAPDV